MQYQNVLLSGRFMTLRFIDNCTIGWQADPATARSMYKEFTFKMNNYWVVVNKSPSLKRNKNFGDVNLVADGVFKIGLFTDVCRLAARQGARITLENKPGFATMRDQITKTTDEYIHSLFSQEFLEHIKKRQITNGVPEQEAGKLYPYQIDAVKKTILYKKGLISMHVNAGKSIIAYSLAMFLYRTTSATAKRNKIVVVVPSITLIEQIYTNFMEYSNGALEGEVAQCYSNAPKKLKDWNRRIILCVRNTFKLKTEYHQYINALIIDEAHELKCGAVNDDKLNNAINGVQAEYKIALSGSFINPEVESNPNMLEYYRVKQMFGDIISAVDANDGIENGRLTPFEIQSLFLNYYDEDEKMRLAYDNYADLGASLREIKKKPYALDYLINKSRKILPHHNTLLLFVNTGMLEIFAEYIRENFPDYEVFIITGSVKGKTREKYRQAINKSRGCFLLGTYLTVSRGLDVSSLTHVIIVDGLKTQSGIVQTLGRALRLDPDKEKAYLYFLVDNTKPESSRKLGIPLKQAKFRQTQFIDNKWQYSNIFLNKDNSEYIDQKLHKYLTDTSVVVKDEF